MNLRKFDRNNIQFKTRPIRQSSPFAYKMAVGVGAFAAHIHQRQRSKFFVAFQLKRRYTLFVY